MVRLFLDRLGRELAVFERHKDMFTGSWKPNSDRVGSVLSV